jgi:transcriptional regulator with XRE-family HTH domain
LSGSSDGLDLSTVGGRIAWARLREDLTQKFVGDAIDKSRATIVQYEGNKIKPPLDMVEELARVLKVSPSFIAFGEHGMKATLNAAEEIVTIPEITFGRDGEYASSSFGLPRRLVDSYSADRRDLKAYVLNHNAPAFDLSSGDRIFVDTSVTKLTGDHDQYLIRTPTGMEIVSYEQQFSRSATVTLTGPRGTPMQVANKDLKILGAVVGTLRVS